MHRITNPNIEILEAAVELLNDLADRLVFLGGCATGLLLTDVAAPPIRVTQDVDVITEVATVNKAENDKNKGGYRQQKKGLTNCFLG